MDILEQLARYKSSAVIMDDINAAKQEIETLRARVAELEADREAITQHYNRKLAACEKERDDWKYERDMMWDAGTVEEFEYIELRQKLAACEKDAARYRWLCDCAGREFEALLPYQMMGQMGDVIDRAMQEVTK
jgi:hypothetical protein